MTTAQRKAQRYEAYGILATKPSNTFLKAMEKVLEGFVKMVA